MNVHRVPERDDSVFDLLTAFVMVVMFCACCAAVPFLAIYGLLALVGLV